MKKYRQILLEVIQLTSMCNEKQSSTSAEFNCTSAKAPLSAQFTTVESTTFQAIVLKFYKMVVTHN